MISSDDVVVSGEWRPTTAQYEAYLKREVELAKHNISILSRRWVKGAPVTIKSDDMLCSSRTFFLAIQGP